MKINNIQIAKKNIKVVPLNLCFDNLHFNYTPGRVIVESKAERENSKALCNLTKFATLMVDDCTLNESNGSNTIFVSSYVSGKKNLLRLYEWVKKYVGIQNINKVAPGLLEALEIEDEDNSVALRFAKYRKLYEESEDSNEEDDNNDEKDENDSEDNDENNDESEEDELTAVIIEVAKGDEDDAKEELIEAGVDEDDIEIIDNEEDEENNEEDKEDKDIDEDDNLDEEDEENDNDNSETVKIRIAVDSFKALKDYLEGKGFNLEDELGGEIIIDDEDEDNDNKDNDDEESDDEFTEFDDLDLFGDEENEKIKDKEK